MNLPLYWSRATADGTDRRGQRVRFSCWRWSNISREDAAESALAAAKRVLRKMLDGEPLGRYGYGDAPLREEVIQRFDDANGGLSAAVTRNAYGVMVLGAGGAMFIDIDFPPVGAGEALKHFFARLFGRKPLSPQSQREAEAVGRLERFVEENRSWGMRLYRTAAGLRALATHDLFDPTADATLDVLRRLGADPLYVRLCKAQACFRARLTPKPWRCGLPQNTVGWPRETEQTEQSFRQWLADYNQRMSGYATCRFLKAIGSTAVHPELETIVEVHDTATRCLEPIELA